MIHGVSSGPGGNWPAPHRCTVPYEIYRGLRLGELEVVDRSRLVGEPADGKRGCRRGDLAAWALVEAALGPELYSLHEENLDRGLERATGDPATCGAPRGYRTAVAWLLEPVRIRLWLRVALGERTGTLVAMTPEALRQARAVAQQDLIRFAEGTVDAIAAWFGPVEGGAMSPHPELARQLRMVRRAPARDGVAAWERPEDPIYCLIRRQSSSLKLVAQCLRNAASEPTPAAAAVLARIARVEADVAAMLVAQRLPVGASIVLPRFALQRRAPGPDLSTRASRGRLRPPALPTLRRQLLLDPVQPRA